MLVWLAIHALAADLRTADLDLERPGAEPLPVRVTWTASARDMPVIVFSHGLGGSREGYQPLAEAWAEHGYLVLQPTHPDSLADRSWRERLDALRDTRQYAAENVRYWDERPAEVSWILDHLDALAGVVPLDRVDRERVGVGGHSFGAHTAALCGGLRTLAGGDHVEPRADAILLLSPQGPGAGIPTDGYGAIRLPTMMVTGSEDVSPVSGQGPDWRLKAWTSLTTEDRWLLFLDGATHTLGGASGRRAGSDPELFGAVVDASTTFWDATLRGDRQARSRLDRGVTTPAGPRIHLGRADHRPDVTPATAATAR